MYVRVGSWKQRGCWRSTWHPAASTNQTLLSRSSEGEGEREREREERGAGGMKQSDMTWRSRWRQTTWVRSDEVLDMP